MKIVIVILFIITLALSLSTNRIQFGSRDPKNAPSGWSLGHPAEATHPISFFIALKQRNLDVLEDFFWAVSNPDHKLYRHFKSMKEVNDLVAPESTDKAKVIEWLSLAGVTRIRDNGDALFVMTTADSASALFATDFHYWEHIDGQSRVLMVNTFSIPEEVAQYVDFVEGLTEFPVPGFKAKPSPKTSIAISPQSIQQQYNIPASANSKGNSSVSVIEFEDENFSYYQLSRFAHLFNVNIPPLSRFYIVGQNNPNYPGEEASLDIQYAIAIGQGSDAWFWIEKEGVWLYGFANHMFNTKDTPLINSISYGWDEVKQCAFGIGGQECKTLNVKSEQYVKRVNTEFQKIGIRGITLIAASGDSGANGRTDGFCIEKTLQPTFPASSPYVTAVGATQISHNSSIYKLSKPPLGCTLFQFNCASHGTEEAVTYDQSHFTSGGGFSNFSTQPSYQATAVKSYFNSGVQLPPSSYYNARGRGYPDVSAFGSSVLVYFDKIIVPVSGTSCSSPIFAGIMSLINNNVLKKTGKPLGFLNPLLYKMAAAQPDTFTDVVTGNNKCTEDGCQSSCKGFICSKGWDPVSGLGTPVFDKIQSYIMKIISADN